MLVDGQWVQDFDPVQGTEETVNANHVKLGYYSIKVLNPANIISLGRESSC